MIIVEFDPLSGVELDNDHDGPGLALTDVVHRCRLIAAASAAGDPR